MTNYYKKYLKYKNKYLQLKGGDILSLQNCSECECKCSEKMLAYGVVMTEIFHLMDANNDGRIDKEEGIAIGRAMGEEEEQALDSWKKMCEDMASEENKASEEDITIGLSDWLEFYKKSLKDAPLDEILTMLNTMKNKIIKSKNEGKWWWER